MKITKRQLKRIIKENLLIENDAISMISKDMYAQEHFEEFEDPDGDHQEKTIRDFEDYLNNPENEDVEEMIAILDRQLELQGKVDGYEMRDTLVQEFGEEYEEVRPIYVSCSYASKPVSPHTCRCLHWLTNG